MRHVSFSLVLFQFWTCDACVPAYCYNGCNYGYQPTNGCYYGYHISDNCGYGGNCYQAVAPVYAAGQPAVSSSHLDGPDVGTIAAIGGGVLAAGAAASAAGIAGLAATGGTLYLARKLRAEYKVNKEEKDQGSDTSIGTSTGRVSSSSRNDSKNNASWSRISANRRISLGNESRSRTRQESAYQNLSNDSESRINLSSVRRESTGVDSSARSFKENGESQNRINHHSRVSQDKKSVATSNSGQGSNESNSRMQLGSLRTDSSRIGRSSRGYSKTNDWSNRISMNRMISVENGSASASESRQEPLSYRDSDSKSRTNLAISRADSSRKLRKATSASSSKSKDKSKSSSDSNRNPDPKSEILKTNIITQH